MKIAKQNEKNDAYIYIVKCHLYVWPIHSFTLNYLYLKMFMKNWMSPIFEKKNVINEYFFDTD